MSSTYRVHSRDFWTAPTTISFIAGAAGASIVWYFTSTPNISGEEALEVFRDLKYRIGELPSIRKRRRWPWDRRRSTSKESGDASNSKISSYSTKELPDTGKDSDTCIGSIFGLDVGGTLAKLVYFEQKSEVEGFRTRSSRASNIDQSHVVKGLISVSNNGKRMAKEDSHPDLQDMGVYPVRLHRWERSVSASSGLSSEDEVRHGTLNSSAEESQKAEAMARFYDFARRLDSHRAGAKDHKLSFYSSRLGGEFHFIQFETRRMQNAMDLIKSNNLHRTIQQMGATGGGAHKFFATWQQQLGITMQKQEELESLVAGMQFVMASVIGECYTYRPPEQTNDPEKAEQKNKLEDPVEADSKEDSWWWSRKVQRDATTYSSAYPYMLVTIGTGVSILRVDGPRKHERISGSTIGGGTYWGLIRLLTQLEDFEEVMRLAERGDATKVDMLVGDIYGTKSDALEKLGLPSNLVASSFGKLVAKEDPANGLTEEDLARALLLMVTNNIGQVAYLNAKLHKTSRIYFVGNFLRQNNISQRRLSYAINYWSKGEMEALFLEHEGYFGALGAFLLAQNIPETKPSSSYATRRSSEVQQR